MQINIKHEINPHTETSVFKNVIYLDSMKTDRR